MENKRKARLEANVAGAEKKVNRAKDAEFASLLITGMTAGCAIIATLMGTTAGLVSEGVMEHTATGVYARDDFQAYAREKANALTEKFTKGEISYTEFKQQYDAIYSKGEVIEFSKTAGDEELTSMVDSYNESQEMMNTLFHKGVPVFGGAALAGIGALGASEYFRKKYEKRLLEAKTKMEEENAAELAD